jgi:methionyl-tRNA formyltransferase
MPLRIIFMGTPDFSVPALKAIVAAGHQVVAVYAQPPRPAGRGMSERKSPVHLCAETLGIPVLTPRTLRTPDAQAAFLLHAADVAVVVAYGLILPKPVLEAPRHGCLNLHASDLPRWRGAAPIQRAIMAGDDQTAVMVMQMAEGLDTGPVCLSETVQISSTVTAGDLHDMLSVCGAALLVRSLVDLEAGRLTATPQSDAGVVYAHKIEKAEAHIDFAQPASRVHNHIRGLSSFPGAWFEVGLEGKTERVKVLRSAVAEGAPGTVPGEVIDAALTVACADGAIRLLELQRAGKKPMSAADLLRGFPLTPGTRLL